MQNFENHSSDVVLGREVIQYCNVSRNITPNLDATRFCLSREACSTSIPQAHNNPSFYSIVAD